MSKATAMPALKRMHAYWYTNFAGPGGRLTPRQRRRIAHKRNHAAAPFGTGAAQGGN
jgi:hypothetical protein